MATRRRVRRPLHRASCGPPPPLRGGGRAHPFSRCGLHPRQRHGGKNFASGRKGEAERRQAHCGRGRIVRMRQRLQREPLASRRSTAALASANERLSSAPAALPGMRRHRVSPASSPVPVQRAPRRPIHICRPGGVRSRLGAGLRAPPAGTAPAPSIGRHRLTSLAKSEPGAGRCAPRQCQMNPVERAVVPINRGVGCRA
jgi:hypothetical protein